MSRIECLKHVNYIANGKECVQELKDRRVLKYVVLQSTERFCKNEYCDIIEQTHCVFEGYVPHCT
jgi:hypothetical protein